MERVGIVGDRLEVNCDFVNQAAHALHRGRNICDASIQMELLDIFLVFADQLGSEQDVIQLKPSDVSGQAERAFPTASKGALQVALIAEELGGRKSVAAFLLRMISTARCERDGSH